MTMAPLQHALEGLLLLTQPVVSSSDIFFAEVTGDDTTGVAPLFWSNFLFPAVTLCLSVSENDDAESEAVAEAEVTITDIRQMKRRSGRKKRSARPLSKSAERRDSWIYRDRFAL